MITGFPDGSTIDATTTNLQLEPGQAYSLVLVGWMDTEQKEQDQVFAVLLRDSAQPPAPGKGRLRVVHAAPGIIANALFARRAPPAC